MVYQFSRKPDAFTDWRRTAKEKQTVSFQSSLYFQSGRRALIRRVDSPVACTMQPEPENDPVDASISYVQDMEIHDDAEDVKTVRFTDGNTTVDVGITDDSMIDFLETAEEVHKRIHDDMASLRDELEKHRDNDEE